MSLSKLSKLPPEVLSCVLNNEAMPMSRRLHLRLICNRWADIIEDALKKETSLLVCDEKAYYLKREPDDVIIKSTDLTDRFTRPLARLFTSLTHLSIYFGVDSSWNKIPSLLAHLDTNNLTTVKLSSYGVDYELIEPIAIADALTDLSRLTSFNLDGYRLCVLLLPHLMPVLSRLEKFGCLTNSLNLAGIISSSLSPRCTHLWLDSVAFQSFPSPFLAQLSNNLLHLCLLNCEATIWQYIFQMHSLSRIQLHFKGDRTLDSSFFSHLSHFTRLTQFMLYRLSYRAPLALPSKKETPLSNIKRLTLGVEFPLDSPPDKFQAFFSAINAWFPKLVHLTIITLSGTIPIIRANLGKQSFSVKIIDSESFYAI